MWGLMASAGGAHDLPADRAAAVEAPSLYALFNNPYLSLFISLSMLIYPYLALFIEASC